MVLALASEASAEDAICASGATHEPYSKRPCPGFRVERRYRDEVKIGGGLFGGSYGAALVAGSLGAGICTTSSSCAPEDAALALIPVAGPLAAYARIDTWNDFWFGVALVDSAAQTIGLGVMCFGLATADVLVVDEKTGEARKISELRVDVLPTPSGSVLSLQASF